MPFSDIYKNKTVIVTGHTGFKGSWLTCWLLELGAKVIGVSLDNFGNEYHFNELNIQKFIIDIKCDIKDADKINEIINKYQPDFLFHLAAQSLVKKSYSDPQETWHTNLIGTLNILEALRGLKKRCSVVLITSDKCYNNVEWVWGYRETDKLGGPDPYSASKGATELLINSYAKSFFSNIENPIRIASGRAGNVIGGGDWSADRVVPDCVKAWLKHQKVNIRNPNATRPWQHVLEPLSGYLNLATKLNDEKNLHGEPFNFGPSSQQNYSVLDLVKEMSKYWDKVKWENVNQNNSKFDEAGLLKLNCDKALNDLSWYSILDFKETVKLTTEWYKNALITKKPILEITKNQIKFYQNKAKKNNVLWAN